MGKPVIDLQSQEAKLIHLHRTFFWQSEQLIPSDRWEDLDAVFDLLPADIMHVNDKETVALTYADPGIRSIMGITKENIATHGADVLTETIEQSNLIRNHKIVSDFVARGNKHEVGVIFQHMNIDQSPGSDYEWYVSFMKLSDKVNGILTLDFRIKFLDGYQNKFMKLIELDEFVHQHMDTFQTLSPREVEILKSVALGNSSQEIGEELSISKLTVDTHRKNIMSKLGVKRFVDLIRFAEAFNLV